MKKTIFLMILLIATTVFSANLRAGEVNISYVLMFHPDMKDFLPEYGRFSGNSYEFEGSEEERIEKREERIKEKIKISKKQEEEIKKAQEELKKKKDELSSVIGDKNEELFKLNGKYMEIMDKLNDPVKVAEQQKKKESEFDGIVKKYEAKIDSINEDIIKLRTKIEEPVQSAKEEVFEEDGKAFNSAFLSEEESIKKAQRVVDTINKAIKEVAQKHRLDIVFNKNSIPQRMDALTFEQVFKDDVEEPEGTFESLPLDEDESKLTEKPLHSLLDSNKQDDIIQYYGERYQSIEELSRLFFIYYKPNAVLYGPNVKMERDLTKEVIEVLLNKYKVSKLVKETALRVIDLMQGQEQLNIN
ncbi:MAG: hypothetical protein C0601_00505 [Candidatus Muiribacterium halophilum]|uniref:Uncharacterized protein n=1 Tax=Muiribacterium halophilum TaxID=2053465 RepID=A0A2N5ZMS6_MUIH1|nr:MAG: hypothetical protein C0601_00505 [Candidatus Muirbacterium halophilum]